MINEFVVDEDSIGVIEMKNIKKFVLQFTSPEGEVEYPFYLD